MRIQRATEEEVATTLKGFRRTTSVSGALTGMGGDMIIIDEPQKPQEVLSEALRNKVTDWLPNTLLTRLNDKETAVRAHLREASGGFFIRQTKLFRRSHSPART
jgi:hypothetical protein